MPPFHAMAMGRAATELEASGRAILHLEVGQPSTPLPRVAADAVRRSLDSPLGYTNAAGLHRLRSRLATRSVDVDEHRVLIVAGASAGFTLAFLTLFDPGTSRVGVIEPGYPCYRNVLAALGIEPVAIPVGPENRWAPTIEQLEAAGDLDGLVIASPSNPTGTVYDDATLAMIASHCRRRGIAIVADEIYHGITYHGPAASILDHEPDAFVVNSFSKYWSMTGWRVGWVVVPDALVDIVERLQQNVYICAPHVSQVAALAALDARRRTRRPRRALPGQPFAVDRWTRRRRHRRHRSGRRRVLRVRPRAAPDHRDRHRLAGSRAAMAARTRGGRNGGCRLRPAARPRVHALLVRRPR